MSTSEVTTKGLRGARPGRDALVGVNVGEGGTNQPTGRHPGRGEQPMVPRASFSSYYGKPIINKPVWEARDIAGYFFLGGLAGASSLVAAGADLTGRRQLSRVMKTGALAAGGLSFVALVHDLGRPERFLNMLRTFKPTSPMSVGSWLLSAYVPAAGAAALSELTGVAIPLGRLATAGAAALGPAVAAYTGALVADTAVPAWHGGHRQMPFVFVASAASAAGGLGLLAAPAGEVAPARLLGTVGGAVEVALEQVMERRMGLPAQAYHEGKAKTYGRLARAATLGGIGLGVLGRKSRLATRLAGAGLLLGSALTRFAIFEAGIVSAEDPKYTVVPQRERLAAQGGVPTPARG